VRDPRPPSGDRGFSTVIGFVIVVAMILASTATIVVLGASAMSDTTRSLDTERAELTLTQLDAKASMVAHGSADSQSLSLPADETDSYVVDESAGWINLSVDTSTGADTTVLNRSLGVVSYTTGDTRIAYQGGGVWRKNDRGRATMVSPPEFHYRGRTLTMPAIAVTGPTGIAGRVGITRDARTRHFPDDTLPGFSNPVEGNAINLTVESDFYRAWGLYFETRTDGDVRFDDDRQVAHIRLVPPLDASFDNAIATTQPNGITVHPPGAGPTPNETGANYPIVDTRIENQITSCQTNPGACDPIPGTITAPGTYFVDGDYAGDLDVDSPGGNVTVVVNGDFAPATTDITNVARPHGVAVHVRADFDVNGGVDYNSVDADAYESVVVLHSDGSFDLNGNAQYVGLVYAPQSDCTHNGGGPPWVTNTRGGLVCQTLTMNGNPTDVQYDAAIAGIDLNLSRTDVTRLQYLHVTTNEVRLVD
jgi:hypothetical protein